MREAGRLQSAQGEPIQHFWYSGFSFSAAWRGLSLAAQFTIVAATVISITMAVLAVWIANQIQNGVVTNTAAAAALYMDRFIEPFVQDLADKPDLSPASQAALSKLVRSSELRHSLVELKIWRSDGTVLFSNLEEVDGERLPITDSLRKALGGAVVSEFDELEDEENVAERSFHVPLLEIYSPIREAKSGRIIAVAEFYQRGDELKSQLVYARLEGVLMVGGLSLLMLGALIGIVRRGNSTIIRQERALSDRISDLSTSLALNAELRQRVAEGYRRASESNERSLRQVSAELHDGPVQLIGLALLRLDEIDAPAQARNAARASSSVDIIRGALREALTEIRGLSKGLALPELEALTFADAIELAIAKHERRSGTSVSVRFPSKLPAVPCSVKTCAYRFVQEGLNNAFRHAGGAGQSVEASWDGARLEIEVSDKGPGMAPIDKTDCASSKSGIGLSGMRDRIESIGGTMLVHSSAGSGTRLRASFVLTDRN
ncbi:MAG TPA: ATP-binding protein [Hyphomicrobiales bacterium]|jgi:signal transduction histidine kinase